MPYTENSIIMRGNSKDIFNCILELEYWPKFIPAIKYSRIIGHYEGKELHEMKARIFGIPSSWKSYLDTYESYKKIKYRQLEGFCDKMEGEWMLTETPNGINVILTHDFDFKLPIIDFIIKPILTKYVISLSDYILRGIKNRIEIDALKKV